MSELFAVSHTGEEYIYVLNGSMVVHTEFYDPVTLGPGQSIYIDSSMGHAYLTAEDATRPRFSGSCPAATRS